MAVFKTVLVEYYSEREWNKVRWVKGYQILTIEHKGKFLDQRQWTTTAKYYLCNAIYQD